MCLHMLRPGTKDMRRGAFERRVEEEPRWTQATKAAICWIVSERGAAAATAAGGADLFLTRQRMTQRASWMDLSASSMTSLLEPLTTMLTVLPGLAQPVI